MATTYGQGTAGRFRIERDLQGECVIIPARRPLVLLFSGLWLAIWIGAGIANFTLISGVEGYLIAVAVGVWLFVCLNVGLLLAWQFTGHEVIRVRGGEIEAAHSILGRARRRSWPVGGISGLDIGDPIPLHRKRQVDFPFLFRPRTGAVKFTHAGRTVRLAQGLNLEEGRRIVEWLQGQLGRQPQA